MKEGTVYRTGRSRRITNAEKRARNQCAANCLLPFIAGLAVLGIGANLFSTERYFHEQQIAFNEVEDKIVTSDQQIYDGDLVHKTDEYVAMAEDYDFGIAVPHSVKLERHTEYCQWSEFTTQECETCERTTDDGDTESYDCNCVETFHYVKKWRNHRINSLLFDQPANHHNPQRDPFPSAKRFAQDVTTTGGLGISPEIVGNFRGPQRPLVFTHHGEPIPRDGIFQRISDSLFGPPPTPRFEPARVGLEGLMSSPAAEQNFIYTNHDDGWFFSPYEASNLERILRGFGQFLEGSLFDWQLGDLYDMINGCTPGDIRVRYDVADPKDLSVMGQMRRAAGPNGVLIPFVARNGFKIGLAHAGIHSPEAMFSNETKEAHYNCKIARALCVIAGVAVIFLTNKLGVTSFAGVLRPGLGVTLLLLASTWGALYGLSDWGGWDSDAWTVGFGVFGVGLLLTSAKGGRVSSSTKKKLH